MTLGSGTVITGNKLHQGTLNAPVYAPISVNDAARLVVDGATIRGNESLQGCGGVSQLGADSSFALESGTLETTLASTAARSY